jgi:signal transduction histidine kinase
LEAFKEHSFYKDSLFNQDKLKEFTRKEMGFEFTKREDSIKMLNDKKIAVKDATLRENKKKIWFYISGIFLLLIIGGMLIFQNRNQKRNNQKLSKLNEDLQAANDVKNKFFNILNHDLRAPVSNVIKLLKLSQNKEFALDENTKLRLESQTIDVAENLLVTMEDLLLWSKGQMQNFKLDYEKVMLNRLFNELMKHYEIGDRNIIMIDIPGDIYLITDENYLKTIIRNLTSNALKATVHVKCPKIRWTAFHKEASVVLKIIDNGKGGDISDFNALFSDEKNISVKSGLGLRLVREMASSVNCKIKVNTIPERGTDIELEFKI